MHSVVLWWSLTHTNMSPNTDCLLPSRPLIDGKQSPPVRSTAPFLSPRCCLRPSTPPLHPQLPYPPLCSGIMTQALPLPLNLFLSVQIFSLTSVSTAQVFSCVTSLQASPQIKHSFMSEPAVAAVGCLCKTQQQDSTLHLSWLVAHHKPSASSITS